MKDIVKAKPGLEAEFLKTAEKLGFTKIILSYNHEDAKKITQESQENIKKQTKIEVEFAIEGEKPKPKHFEQKILLGTKTKRLSKDATILLNNESEEEKDFTHQRRSGLNHVILEEAKQKEIEIYAGLNQVLGRKNWEQTRILGRMKQNLKLTKKKKINYEIISYAGKPENMRKAKDIESLKRELEKNK